jgi:hypothetical protein
VSGLCGYGEGAEVKVIHISCQRYDFILSQGYRFKNAESYIGGGGTFEHVEAPNAVIYHLLDDELGYCKPCEATCQGVDANSPSELEIVKTWPLDKAIIALRNQRQSDILTVREYWTNKAA